MKKALLLLVLISPLISRAQYQNEKQNVEACFSKWMNSLISLDFENLISYSAEKTAEISQTVKQQYEAGEIPEDKIRSLQSIKFRIVPEATEISGDVAYVHYIMDYLGEEVEIRTRMIRKGEIWLTDMEPNLETEDYAEDDTESTGQAVPEDYVDDLAVEIAVDDPQFESVPEVYDSTSEAQFYAASIAQDWLAFYHSDALDAALERSTEETKKLINQIMASVDDEELKKRAARIRSLDDVRIQSSRVQFPDDHTAVVPYSISFSPEAHIVNIQSTITLHRSNNDNWLVHYTEDDLEMEYRAVDEE